jgi:hypothetical protein
MLSRASSAAARRVQQSVSGRLSKAALYSVSRYYSTCFGLPGRPALLLVQRRQSHSYHYSTFHPTFWSDFARGSARLGSARHDSQRAASRRRRWLSSSSNNNNNNNNIGRGSLPRTRKGRESVRLLPKQQQVDVASHPPVGAPQSQALRAVPLSSSGRTY